MSWSLPAYVGPADAPRDPGIVIWKGLRDGGHEGALQAARDHLLGSAPPLAATAPGFFTRIQRRGLDADFLSCLLVQGWPDPQLGAIVLPPMTGFLTTRPDLAPAVRLVEALEHLGALVPEAALGADGTPDPRALGRLQAQLGNLAALVGVLAAVDDLRAAAALQDDGLDPADLAAARAALGAALEAARARGTGALPQAAWGALAPALDALAAEDGPGAGPAVEAEIRRGQLGDLLREALADLALAAAFRALRPYLALDQMSAEGWYPALRALALCLRRCVLALAVWQRVEDASEQALQLAEGAGGAADAVALALFDTLAEVGISLGWLATGAPQDARIAAAQEAARTAAHRLDLLGGQERGAAGADGRARVAQELIGALVELRATVREGAGLAVPEAVGTLRALLSLDTAFAGIARQLARGR
jgi:hypothetical protein